MTSATGKEPSQPEVVKPSRIEGRFGSTNPYLLEGAGALPSTDNKYFGPGKGIGFKKIDYIQLMTIMEERLKDNTEGVQPTKERVLQGANNSVAKLDETINNFVKQTFASSITYDIPAHPPLLTPILTPKDDLSFDKIDLILSAALSLSLII